MTVFKITPSGALTTLYTFTNRTDGSQPFAPPIQGTDGNFYGTTCQCYPGAAGSGTIYKITLSGTFTALYQFDGTHGSNPVTPLVLGTDGNFYGSTQDGGAFSSCSVTGHTGCGVIFKVTSGGKLTVLYSFDGTDGADALPLIQGSDGNFYSTGRHHTMAPLVILGSFSRLPLRGSISVPTEGGLKLSGFVW